MTYPKYYKTSAHQIKAIDPESSLWVNNHTIVRYGFHYLEHLKCIEATESTETEFKKAFNKTSKYLKSLI